MSTWEEYQKLARHLDGLVYEHEHRAAALASEGEEAAASAEDLTSTLDEQREQLESLGRLLDRGVFSLRSRGARWSKNTRRVGRPPATFTGVTDSGQALRLAREHLSAAQEALERAQRYASRPVLLPGLPVALRNLVVYLAAALLAALAQYLLVLDEERLSSWTVLAWSYAGFPASAWILGYVVLTVWGRPRDPAPVPPANSWQPPGPAPSPAHGARFGFALCFLAMPIAHLFITQLGA